MLSKELERILTERGTRAVRTMVKREISHVRKARRLQQIVMQSCDFLTIATIDSIHEQVEVNVEPSVNTLRNLSATEWYDTFVS